MMRGRAGTFCEVKKARRYLSSNSEADPEHTIGIGNYGAETWVFSVCYFKGFLRRQQGGQIPRTVDVYNPQLNTKVTVDIAESKGSTVLYRVFTRENLIQLCLESLRKVPDYEYLIEKVLENGKSLQLAWRYQANLDWVWLDQDVFGKPREWSVLCGLAFKQVGVSVLSLSLIFI
jgi:hypothetical protein